MPHGEQVDSICKIDDGKIISVGGNKCVLWDLRKSIQVWEVTPHQKSILDVAYSKSHNRVITCGLDSIVKFLDCEVK